MNLAEVFIKRPITTTLIMLGIIVFGVIVAAPLIALIAAIPFAWGWGLGWSDIVIAGVFYVITGLGVTVGLLPGEDPRDYEVLRQMIVDDIQPQSNVEWLWTLDLVELSREILRYRRLKKSILDVHWATAIEAILRRLDGEGMPTDVMPMVHLYAKRTAAEWRDNRDAASETEARLRRSGVDKHRH